MSAAVARSDRLLLLFALFVLLLIVVIATPR
jgi:hypothetical protein